MAVNETNSWGHAKPKIATWFFLTPWQTPFFSFLLSLTKTTQIMNWHWWGDACKIVKTVHQQCLTCLAHNPRKTIFIPRGFRTLPSGPFEHLLPDLIQLPFSMGYRYVLVIVCMF